MKRFASVPARRRQWAAHWQALPRAWRRGAVALGVALVLVVPAAIALRDPLGRWLWPDPRYDALRQRADLALQAGHLTGRDGARALYEAALALQPDQLDAREGLARVARAALVQAEAHLRAGEPAQALVALQLARDLQAPAGRVDALQRQAQALQARAAGLEALLARAQAAQASGRLDDGPDAALPLYQQVLQARPRDQWALEGREDALSDLLRPATAALARGDLALAAERLRRAERFDPGHVALPALHAGLARAVERRGARVQRLLAARQVTTAAQMCAVWRREDSGLQPPACAAPLGEALLAAATAAAPRHPGDAARLLAMAADVGTASNRLQAVQRRLQSDAGDAAAARDEASPRRHARVAEALAQAERARQRGDWLTPPGDSVWDHLRVARALAPRDPRVLRETAELQVAAQRCHADALRDNTLGRAGECLQAWRQLAPADDGLAAAQRRLAQRWLAVGSEWLEAGRPDDARRALAQARAVDPGVPGLDAFAERLRRAR